MPLRVGVFTLLVGAFSASCLDAGALHADPSKPFAGEVATLPAQSRPSDFRVRYAADNRSPDALPAPTAADKAEFTVPPPGEAPDGPPMVRVARELPGGIVRYTYMPERTETAADAEPLMFLGGLPPHVVPVPVPTWPELPPVERPPELASTVDRTLDLSSVNLAPESLATDPWAAKPAPSSASLASVFTWGDTDSGNRVTPAPNTTFPQNMPKISSSADAVVKPLTTHPGKAEKEPDEPPTTAVKPAPAEQAIVEVGPIALSDEALASLGVTWLSKSTPPAAETVPGAEVDPVVVEVVPVPAETETPPAPVQPQPTPEPATEPAAPSAGTPGAAVPEQVAPDGADIARMVGGRDFSIDLKPPKTAFPNDARDLDAIKKRGVLVVGQQNGDNPPFYFFEPKTGRLVGLDIDVAIDLAKHLGVKLVVNRSFPSFDSVAEGVQAGFADIGVTNMSVTDKRKDLVDFSEPYIIGYMALLINFKELEKRLPKDAEIIGPSDLNRPEVVMSVEAESSFEDELRTDKKEKPMFPKATARRETYGAGDKRYASLLDGRAQVMLRDTVSMLGELMANPEVLSDSGGPLTYVTLYNAADPIGIPIAKTAPKLRAEIDRFLETQPDVPTTSSVLRKYGTP